MALQIAWNGFKWGYSNSVIRAIDGLSTNRSISVERVKEKGKKDKQTVSLELGKLSFTYTVSALAGGNPRKEYDKIYKAIGVHAPLYLHRKKFVAKRMMLKKVSADDWILDGKGRVVAVTITVEFEEYVTDKRGLKKDKITKKKALRKGISKNPKTKSALRIGATSAQKSSKSKKNKRMKR